MAISRRPSVAARVVAAILALALLLAARAELAGERLAGPGAPAAQEANER